MMRLALVGLCLLTMTPEAGRAAVVDVVITGTLGQDGNTFNIGNAYDTYGNVWNGELVQGAAFTARYVYDTSRGSRSNMVNNFPADVLDGTDEPPSNPPSVASASLTIGGTTVNLASPASQSLDRDSSSVFVAPTYFPSPIGFPNYGFDWARYSVSVESYGGDPINNGGSFDYSIGGWLSFDINAILGTLPSDLETGYSLAANPYDIFVNLALPTIFGTFYLADYRSSTDKSTFRSFVQLYGEQITVTVRNPDPSAVPLPASALMLGAAVGLIGALRRKRRSA